MKHGFFVLPLILLLSLAPAAQEPATLSVDVRLVNVVATVTDAAGRYVPGLTAEDFSVAEDGVPQKISHFTQDNSVPVSVGILLDTSGSMAAKIQTATQAVERFINRIHEDDDIFLMTIDRRVTLRQDFTSDRKRLSQALRSIRVGGGTLLYDGLNEGLRKIADGRHDKRALLVISDGMDQGSRRTSRDGLLRNIRRAEVLVYGLGASPTTYADPVDHIPFTLPTTSSVARGPSAIANPRPAPRRGPAPQQINSVDMSVMRQFADSSGGQAFLLSDTFIDTGKSDIDRILTEIADELRGQYTLGYYPSAPDDGAFHSIDVKVRGGYTVRSRSGYQGR